MKTLVEFLVKGKIEKEKPNYNFNLTYKDIVLKEGFYVGYETNNLANHKVVYIMVFEKNAFMFDTTYNEGYEHDSEVSKLTQDFIYKVKANKNADDEYITLKEWAETNDLTDTIIDIDYDNTMSFSFKQNIKNDFRYTKVL